MAGKPFALIGVNSDSVEDALAAVKKEKLNWRSFQNTVGDRVISDEWFISGWPTILILDAERKIHYRGHDGMAATEIAERLVAEMTAK